jgi:hypothetical protein
MTSIPVARWTTCSVLLLLALGRSCYAQYPPVVDPEIVTIARTSLNRAIVVLKGSLQAENVAAWTAYHGSQPSISRRQPRSVVSVSRAPDSWARTPTILSKANSRGQRHTRRLRR